ncbi:hypothetical protein NR798_00455 [Archangium gephyra]|uniref:hypothetical protein n=1 Tax=Archangium gephyra TaxID=48 RepID=UPI0035D408C6
MPPLLLARRLLAAGGRVTDDTSPAQPHGEDFLMLQNAGTDHDRASGESTGNGSVTVHPSNDLEQSARQYAQVINKANRMLCGSAYKRGLWSGLALLGALRRGYWVAPSPENNLDLEQISIHACRAVRSTLLFSMAALGTLLGQLLLVGFSLVAADKSLNTGPSVFALMGASFGFIVLNLLGAGLVAYEWWYLRWANARRFLSRNFQPGAPVREVGAISGWFRRWVLNMDLSQNVVVFGGYEPFLGSGGKVSGWTLAIERKPPQDSMDPGQRISIPVEDFYHAVDEAVDRMQLPHLQTKSLLLVRGWTLKPDGEVLVRAETQPISQLPEEKLWRLGHGDLSSEKRFYRLYRYLDTARDMTLSYYLRFYNVGAVTFVEGSTYLLTSVDESRYGLKPLLRGSRAGRVGMTGLLTLLLFPLNAYVFVALYNVFRFLARLYTWHREDASQRRAIRDGEQYSYGVARSFRERVASPFYHDYYGVQDLTMYRHAIDDAALGSIKELLREHGVDVSRFEEQATTIINSGIMVSGGQFTATQAVAGSGAMSVIRSNGGRGAADSKPGSHWPLKTATAARSS